MSQERTNGGDDLVVRGESTSDQTQRPGPVSA